MIRTLAKGGSYNKDRPFEIGLSRMNAPIVLLVEVRLILFC